VREAHRLDPFQLAGQVMKLKMGLETPLFFPFMTNFVVPGLFWLPGLFFEIALPI